MKKDWRFAGLKTGRSNVIKDFLSKDVMVQNRVESFLRRLRTLPIPWPSTYYDGSLGGGLGELRVDYRNVEYRFYGFFGPGSHQFTVIIASDDKKKQRKTIKAAKQLKKTLDQGVYDVEDYDV
jgi:putative component of toxin-antitoxin plasmid stabilization module